MKINILFIIKNKSKTNNKNKCPIACRITLDKKRKEFSTGQFINPKHWDGKLQIVKPPEPDSDYINTQLSLIRTKLTQAFLFLQVQEINFTLSDIYNQFKGKPVIKNTGLVFHFNEYLEKSKRLIGTEIKQSTWNKFLYIKNDLSDFIKFYYKQNDFLLKELDYSFILEFEYYLKTEKLQKQVTVNKSLQRLKRVVKTAIINKLIDFNPFLEHRPKRVITNIVYLTVEELGKFEKHQFSQTRLEIVKDLFIFCCYTGLPFNEMSNLKAKHIEIGFDGYKWIKMVRDKTRKVISVPLLSKSEKLIEKYKNESEFLLPRISNQKFNSYIKEIAEIVGIEKNITHHTARKTFATTILLYNDIPIEIVSELLGHSKISITQEHYGKIVQKKVSEHIQELSKKLKN